MGFFDNIKKKVTGNVDPEFKKKQYLLTHLKSTELAAIEKAYYGKKLKFHWVDEHGIERSRDPSRLELVNAICYDVPTDIILDTFPKLRSKLE